jgi:O-antigen/teichoic acid export membrane protein
MKLRMLFIIRFRLTKRLRQKLSKLVDAVGKKLDINLSFFLKNGFWVSLSQLVVLVTGAGLMVILARYLSQETFGLYQFLIAWISTFSLFSIPDLNASILHSVANGKDGTYKKALRVRFRWSFIGVPILAGLAFYYYHFQSDPTLGLGLLMIALVFPFLHAPTSWTVFLQAKERFDLSSKYASIYAVLNFIAISASVFIGEGQLLPVFGTYLLIMLLSNLFFLKGSFKLIKNEEEDNDWKDYGFFLTKINVLAILAGRLDIILVGVFLGIETLAIYSIGSRFAILFQTVLNNLLTIVTPTIARQNTLDFKKYFQIFLGTSVISLILILITPSLIIFLFTDKYAASIYLSQIILAFSPFFVMNNLYAKHVKYYLKDRKWQFIETISSPIIRTIIMTLLLYYFSVIGMAVAQGLKQVVSLFIFYVLFKFSSKSK